MLLMVMLLGTSPPPKPPKEEKDEPAQSEIGNTASTINGAITKLQLPVEEYPPCKPGKDNRESDLCAQWKAADAARDAAEYAGWATLFGFVGTVLLVFTFWETRRTSRAELRAYVSANIKEPHFADDGTFAKMVVLFKNHGATPAFKCRHSGEICIKSEEAMEVYLSEHSKRTVRGQAIYFSLHPGDETTGDIRPYEGETFPNLFDVSAAQSRGERLYIYGTLLYEDAFKRRRESRFCYWMEWIEPENRKAGEGFEEMEIGSGHVSFRMANFHNTST